MPNAEYDNLVLGLVSRVVDKISVLASHKFAELLDALPAANPRKQENVRERGIDVGAHAAARRRIALVEVIGDVDEIRDGPRRKPQFHRSKRRNAASTSLSLANWRRFACAKPSSTSAR